MSSSSVQQTDRDWIHRCDDHAAARLRLLDDAEVLLGRGDMSSQHEASRLAERVERWRSHWLRRAGHQVIWSSADAATRECVPCAPVGGQI